MCVASHANTYCIYRGEQDSPWQGRKLLHTGGASFPGDCTPPVSSIHNALHYVTTKMRYLSEQSAGFGGLLEAKKVDDVYADQVEEKLAESKAASD